MERDRHRQTDRERERERQTDRDTEKHRQRERERDRDSEREREREMLRCDAWTHDPLNAAAGARKFFLLGAEAKSRLRMVCMRRESN